MKTAQQLKDKYEKDMNQLQENCKHEKISDWLMTRDFHGNAMNEVNQCEICWTYLQRKLQCLACNKHYIISEKEYRCWEDQLCPKCQEKGKYYCLEHKKYYDNPSGCSKCIEFLEEVEGIEAEGQKRRNKR